MDSLFDQELTDIGLMISDAVDALVDRHDGSLDKVAAMMQVTPPKVARQDSGLAMEFAVSGSRSGPAKVSLDIGPSAVTMVDPQGEEELVGDLLATAHCQCDQCQRSPDGYCPQTLAAAWWVQEQISRHGSTHILEMLGSLQVDTVSAGRELVRDLLRLAGEAEQTISADVPTRLQWRLRLASSRYYCPVAISAFEQRPRKDKRGWTKGRAIDGRDLLHFEFKDSMVDGRVAGLTSQAGYSLNEDYFESFQALRLLAGHANVVWEEHPEVQVDVSEAELALSIQVVESAMDDDDQPSLPSDESLRYRPVLSVPGMNIDPTECTVILGRTSPVDPVVVLVDQQYHRVVICSLRDPHATRIVQYLLRGDFDDMLLDHDAATRLAVAGAKINPLLQVELPSELAGPIEPMLGEFVFDLRPRGGAGLKIAVRLQEPRLDTLLTPGQSPSRMRCLTSEGPLQLQRDLSSERRQADAIVERFELDQCDGDGSYRWIVKSDDEALETLARLYAGGSDPGNEGDVPTPAIVWPEGELFSVRGEIKPSSLRVQIDDRKDWFGLKGTVNIDGTEVPLEQLLSAVKGDKSLIQVGDREFARISAAFRSRLQTLGDTVLAEGEDLMVGDAAMPTVQELLGEDILVEATERWHQSIAKLDELADWMPEKPEDLDAQLRDYQLDGYRWLARLSAWGVGGVLADDMGLGKTVQALGVLLERAPEGPALVIAPTSVGENWIRETHRFAPTLRPIAYRQSDRDQTIRDAGPSDLIVVSYQLLQRDAERFSSRSWHTMVLDEAQFIKNAQTKTSSAIRAIDADWRIGLSGTPLENHLGELWSLFRTISPGLLGSWGRFRSRFAEPIERHHDQDRRQTLSRLVRPFILRRTKDTVLTELPPRTEINLRAELSANERRIYEETRIAALAELGGESEVPAGQQRIKTLAWLTRLRQLACHPRLVDAAYKESSAKLELFASTVEELRDGGHRALVFSQFVKHLQLVRKRLDDMGITYQYLDGSTPTAKRAAAVDAFQNGVGDLFLISLKAGGTGLNLTAADYVLHLDPWWNPAVEDQATDRAHRMGQQRPVTVYRLVSGQTIEEQILEMHGDKRELVAGVLEGTDAAGKIDTAELIELIKSGA
ncbi:MAG: DEAD/DEAH box helicase [Planctomycetota bacterium]